MKKIFTLSVFILGIATLGQLLGQNAEIPTKKPTNPPPPQTGGPQSSRGSSENRPVYMPRPIQRPPVIWYPAPVYSSQNNSTGNSQNQEPSAEEVARANREVAKIELKKVLWEMNAPEQVYDIKDVTKPFEVVGTKGFRIVFPELAFVDDEGNPVLGEVEVKLTEYTNNAEFAAAGLTTMTTDGKLLETGGMVNLEAFSGEKKVQLQQGKTIEIVVPNMEDQNGFQTFYASGTDVITWSTTPANNSDDNSEIPFDGYTIKMLKSTQAVKGQSVNYTIFKNWESLEDYVNKNLKVPAETRSKILKDGIPFLYTIQFNALGKIKEVKPKYPEYAKNSLISDLQGKIKTILMEAPAISMNDGNVQSGKPYEIVFVTAKNYTQKVPIPVKFPMAAGKENAPSALETNMRPTEKNVNEFGMNSSQLTKINCDRFSSNSSTDTQGFHFDRADATVYVVFKNQRSFIQPSGANGNYVMRGIPSNSEVRYVAVVYGDDGSVNMGVRDARTENGEVDFGPLAKFNAEDFKAALNAN